jgi:signal transduction histidine kinase
MSDLSGAFPIPSIENVRALARLIRERRGTLAMAGEIALVLASAGSIAGLLRVPGAPSASFVVQCFALGLSALVAARARALRAFLPALSIGVAASLVGIVLLEVVRASDTAIPLEIAGCVAILPILLLQISGWRMRTLVASGGTALVVAAAAAAGMQGPALLQLGIALAFAISVAAIAVAGLDARRERSSAREGQLRRTVLRERRLMRAREEMIANLSHDLRNPLAIALGFSEMAEDDDLPADERTHALHGLRRSLWEMSQLVENVLDKSADQAGALTPSLEPIDLATLCQDALSATAILIRRRPIVLEGSIEAGVVVLADRQRLARVLGNLLSNACKYTAAGAIRLETASRGRFAVIRVHDTGTGIPADAVPFIFDRFRRAHDGGPAGVGLGLAIAHRLVERMGGTLDVETELGVGSIFTIILPLVANEGSESVAA